MIDDERRNDRARQRLVDMLRDRTGQTLCDNRRWRIDTALKPVLILHQFLSLADLVDALDSHRVKNLSDEVTDALLNNESYFFRDHMVFHHFGGPLLDEIRARQATRKTLSIWAAGCSTGQEIYSIAMMIADNPERWRDWRIHMVATDVSKGAIARARAGLYSQFEIQRGLPVTKMVKWFDKQGENWAVRPELRNMIEFRQQNMLDESPCGGPFDVILCRNVLLYFSLPVRMRAFACLDEAIAPDGYLMLGAGETVIGQTDAFHSSVVHRGYYRPTKGMSSEVRRTA